jgi:hypothetical protein
MVYKFWKNWFGKKSQTPVELYCDRPPGCGYRITDDFAMLYKTGELLHDTCYRDVELGKPVEFEDSNEQMAQFIKGSSRSVTLKEAEKLYRKGRLKQTRKK